MAMETNSIAAQNTSFWGLITNSLIQVPNYQREYAQGRNNRRAELIRNSFVTSLYGSIKNNEPLELDFIFGGKESDDKENNSFNPVDGQQRLTILFLLIGMCLCVQTEAIIRRLWESIFFIPQGQHQKHSVRKFVKKHGRRI